MKNSKFKKCYLVTPPSRNWLPNADSARHITGLSNKWRCALGLPPEGATYPFWAWHTIEWKHQKPDLRRTEFRAYRGNQVWLELEIPDNMVLLSNEDMWHIVLNDGYYSDCSNEREVEIEDRWFENLPPDKQIAVKVKSWEKIFNVSPPFDNTWESRGKYVQATFWELTGSGGCCMAFSRTFKPLKDLKWA